MIEDAGFENLSDLDNTPHKISATAPATVPSDPQAGPPVLSVLVPVFNEQATLRIVFDKLRTALGPEVEILLVDDGSTDASRSMVEELGELPLVVAAFHPRNLGKGSAIRTGLALARGEFVAIQDADLEYDPQDLDRLFQAARAEGVDAVYGSRFSARSDPFRGIWDVLHFAGNRTLTWWSNLFTGLALTDMETCYKVIRRQVLADVQLKARRFSIEPELTAVVSARARRILELPVSYSGRSGDQGKKITWRDGVSALCAVPAIAWWTRRLRKLPG